MLSALAGAAPKSRQDAARPPPPPGGRKKGYFFPVRYNPSSNKQFGMSYEYHKHPKKNWGQPPAFRLPSTDGSEKTDKRTVPLHMRQGGTGRYLFFSRLFPVFSFRGRESTLGFPSCMAYVFCRYHWILKEGYFLHSLLFAPLRFNLPFFPLGSLSSHDLPQRGR